MTVTEGWFSGVKVDHPPAPSELQPELFELLKSNIALNSKVGLAWRGGLRALGGCRGGRGGLLGVCRAKLRPSSCSAAGLS
jgi:hypothetical protein